MLTVKLSLTGVNIGDFLKSTSKYFLSFVCVQKGSILLIS